VVKAEEAAAVPAVGADSGRGAAPSGDADTDSSGVRSGVKRECSETDCEGAAGAQGAAALSLPWRPSPFGATTDDLILPCGDGGGAGGALDAGALWAHIGARLRPLSAAAGRCAMGPASRAAASRDAAAARLFARELPHLRELDEKMRTGCAAARACVCMFCMFRSD
jgi:hypothetical protein